MATHEAAPTPRPRAKWGDKEGRNSEIRDAARDLLRREGLAGLSMRAVAQEARVALGTVYTYFSSKEALYADLYAERLEELVDEIAASCAGAHNAEEVFARIANLYFDVYATFGREFNVWSVLTGLDQVADTGAEPDEVTVRLINAAIAVFEVALDEIGRVEPALADVLRDEEQLGIQLLWVNLNGLADHFASLRHLLHDSPRERLLHYGIDVFLAGLRAQV